MIWLLLVFLFLFPLLVPFLVIFLSWIFSGLIGVSFIHSERRSQFRSSDIYFPTRKDIHWDKHGVWPRGDRLFYQCLHCQKTLPSDAKQELSCGCGNLFVGPEHIGAENRAKVRLFEE